ncbi:uncharacterized protein LOC117305398 [Asterias rubens]|uniref:uncharacterized protein LOC117305398 n=1 Tax=Asterias rubens TaxID=7604 RepID=UPI001455B1E1|nr:uncharacterized protein LOC117305398 [Asterias rubens]
MITCKQLTYMLQIKAAVLIVTGWSTMSSPLPISFSSRANDGMTRHLRSVLSERQEENTFFQDRRGRRDYLTNHTSDETPTSLTTTTIFDRLQRTIPNEPECIAHHEYAVIVPPSQANDPGMLRFESNNGEIRYYFCHRCSICNAGVRILRHCTSKRNTVCSYSECIDPEDFFDPYKRACFKVPQSSGTTTPPMTTPPPVRCAIKSVPEIEIGDEVDHVIQPQLQGSHVNIFAVLLLIVCITLLTLMAVASMIFRRLSKRGRAIPRSSLEISSHSTVTVIDNPQRTYESSRCQLEVGLAQDLIVSLDHQESQLGIQREQETFYNQENSHDEIVNGAVSVLKGTSPYWLVMMGHFGPEGGVLRCQDSDVVLEIPPGAIPTSHPHQLIQAKISLTPSAAAPELASNPDFLCLTPVVEFESPGLDKFRENVLIRLPHKACMTYDPSWSFRAHFTDPTSATKINPTPATTCKVPLSDPWYFVNLKNHMSKSGRSSQRRSESMNRGVSCTVDERYFNISTPHFSKYACSGCHKNHPLHFETVVYASHLKVGDKEEVKLIIYIMDPIKQREANPPRSRVSDYHSVILEYNKKSKDNHSLEVTLIDGIENDDWQWKLQYENHVKCTQLIKYQHLVRCCSCLGPFLHTFDLELKPGTMKEPLSVFKAMLSFRQQHQNAGPLGEPVKFVVTLPLSDQCFQRQLSSARNTGSIGSTRVIENHIDVVLRKLLPKDWRRLFRKLMGTDVENEIQCIVARNPTDVNEHKHDALLSWTRSHGRAATLNVLISALRSCELTEIAESLEEITNRNLLKETAI